MPMYLHATKIFTRSGTFIAILGLFFAAAVAERLPIKSYTTADGLAHNHINRIKKDSRGFLWFCTDEGLSRFDGYKFISYTTAHGLPHPDVNDFLEARDGTIWLATDNGICRVNPKGMQAPYDPATQAQQPFITVYATNGGENSQRINTLAEDQNGNIWCATSNGLFRVERHGEQVLIREVEIGLPHEKRDDSHVSTVIIDRQGIVWAGAISGLYRYFPDARSDRFTVQDGLPDNYVQTSFLDIDGSLWFGTRNGGFFHTTVPASSSQRLQTTNWTTKDGLPYTDTRQIFRAQDGQLWLANRAGLVKFNPNGSTAQERFTNYTTANGLSENQIFKIAEDNAGNMWLGTMRSGVMRLTNPGFVTYDATDGIQPHEYNSIWETKLSELTICAGGLNGALFTFDGAKFHQVHPNIPALYSDFGVTGQPSFLQDRSGRWWIATMQGLLRFAPVTRLDELAGARPEKIFTIKNGLPSSKVRMLIENMAGDIWLTTETPMRTKRPDLVLWQRSRDQVVNYGPDITSAFEKHFATSIAEDGDGNLWLGLDYDGGLIRYRQGKFTFYPLTDGSPSGNINHLFLDQRKRLWVASSIDGLMCITDPSADQLNVIKYTVKDGLSSNETWSITEDELQRIYVSTGRGIDRLDPATKQIIHYNQEDGLAEGLVQASYCDGQGRLWFVSNRGVSRLDPAPDRPMNLPQVSISGIQINGIPQHLSALGEEVVEKLELTAAQNQIQFDFLVQNFFTSERIRYQYKLEGSATDWSAPAEERSINFASLSSGNYRFLVRAINSAGKFNDTPASVTFTILPPLWQRWWFLLFMALTVGLVAYGLHRYRLQQLLAVEKVRARLATDLHDDVGASLSQIAILSEVSRQRVGTESNGMRLEQIAATSRDALDAMSDIVWATNPERDRVRDLTQRMREFASDVLTAREIDFSFTAPPALEELKIEAELRRQIYLIFKEIINNAARHSQCTEVKIALTQDDHHLQLHVGDNGTGFDPQLARDGNGLKNIVARVDAMGGTAKIQSQAQQGTTIQVRLPLRPTRHKRPRSYLLT